MQIDKFIFSGTLLFSRIHYFEKYDSQYSYSYSYSILIIVAFSMDRWACSPRYEEQLSIIKQSSAETGTIASQFSNPRKTNRFEKQFEKINIFEKRDEKKRINSEEEQRLGIEKSRESRRMSMHEKQNLINQSNKMEKERKIEADMEDRKQKIREKLMIQEQELSYESQAKIEIANEQKLYKIFSFWKSASQKSNHYKKEIIQEEMKVKKQLKTKYQVLKAWKAETIIYRRVAEYHQKKIYRNFFMVCSFELQLRLRSIYLEQILRINRFPKLIKCLKVNESQKRLQAESLIKKINLKKWVKQTKMKQIQKKTKKLAVLFYQLKVKKKFWSSLRNALPSD